MPPPSKPSPPGPAQHKKLLPSGTPPPQRTGPLPTGQKQVLRVNRACNSCRRQKMRCEGPDNPPCVRCKTAGIQCIFEKVSKPENPDSASSERIKELENQLEKVKGTQIQMQGTLLDILQELRHRPYGSPNGTSVAPPSHLSPQMLNGSVGSGSVAAPSPFSDSRHHSVLGHSPPASSPSSSGAARPVLNQSSLNNSTASSSLPPIQSIISQYSPAPGQSYHETSHPSPHSINYSSSHSPTISFPTPVPVAQHMPSQTSFTGGPARSGMPLEPPDRSKLTASPANSDLDIPSAALLAPIEVINDIAESAMSPTLGDSDIGQPKKRKRLDDSEEGGGGHVRRLRRGSSLNARGLDSEFASIELEKEMDVIDKGIVSLLEAKELYGLYFSGCHRLLAVFDPKVDTFESLRQRSPFCFCCVLMVAAKVRDGGNPPSAIQRALQKEASERARDTMFRTVRGIEGVQAMLLIAAWSHSTGGTGWLTAGHAIRCAVELGLHKALPRLAKKMQQGPTDGEDDRILVTAARTWCALFVFEYQLSFGTGRPAMMGDDKKGVHEARNTLLQHPLSIATDARLVSTCELLSLQGKIHEALGPHDDPVDDARVTEILREARLMIDAWLREWDGIMSHDHASDGFFRTSASIQRSYAHLFHNSIAMRNLRTSADVKAISPGMKQIALDAISAARECIDICLNNKEYRDGLRFAVSYTHTCAAFAGAFMLRVARLFPQDVDLASTVKLVEDLVGVLSQVPASRFSESLKTMLSHTRQRAEQRPPAFNHPSYPPPAVSQSFTNDFAQLLHSAPTPAQNAATPIMDPTFPDGQGVAMDSLFYPGWMMTDLQMTGDLITPMDFVYAGFASDLQ